MVEQLQVALGLKEAVSRWCCPPSSPQLVSSEEGREGGIVFLQQLLLLQQLDGSQAPPIPPQLLREEAAEAPKSCTSPHTDSVALLINPYSCSSLNSRINGVHSGASIQQEGAPGVSESPRAPDGPPAGRRSLQQSSNMSYCYAASERHAAFFTSPTLSCRGPLSFGGPEQREEEGMQATAEGEPPEGPQFVAHSDMNAAAMFPDNAGPLLADATSAAVSGAVSAEVQKQRGQQQQQRGQQQQQRGQQQQQRPRLSQVVQQQKAAAAATAAKVTKEKGIKRRPEQQGAPRGTSLVAAAAVSPATGPPLQVIGGPVPRGEGPPQKRQAVGKRRGETGAGVRSSSNNSRSKTGGGGFPTKTAAAAASRVSSAGVAENSSSSNSSSCCRVTLSSAKSCPQLQLKQQQDTKSLQESPSDIEAAEDAAAAAALAAARCSSSSSSGDGAEAAVRAFAAEWLRGCQQRLEAMRAKARKESITRSSSSSNTGDVSASVSSAAASNTHEELQQAKKQLKQELRSYNISFAAHFGRQPLKQDKEPLRPVYMHYQRIKQRLEQHLAAAEGNSPLVSAAAAVGVGGSADEGQGSATAATTSLPAVSNVATSNSRRSSTADCSSSSAVAAGAATAAPSPAPTKRQKAPHNLRVPEVLSPKATAHRGRPSGGGPRSPAKASKEKQQQKPVSARPSAYDRQQQQQKRREEMALQLHQLQRERRSLGDKLAAYHLQFKQEHGRPLRLKADIAPVHQEYKLFVEITKQIEALAFALQKQTL
ncbi:hypothetical protein, conserved [Eimeria maxima]|uniref:FAM13A-like domain-containing protein n=1 Tax=Eimeria maxima TaxID=5804 RepID=U6M8F9_EIMMA|nr:hypothetical protein, conserved [Eimeria maxima]CDJ58749.1 hypothetical protein, conserved [Eimeria maxima]